MKTKQSTRTTIQESDDGVMFRAKEIPGCLFNFYVLRTNRQYKDGTYCWNVCAEYTANPKQTIKMDSIRGDKKDAIARLDEILKHGR